MALADKFHFFFESIKTIGQSGTITQSSPALCRAMTDHITDNDKVIIEIGAGDGAITKYILNKCAPDAKVLSFEINPKHFARLSKIEDARFTPLLESAETLVEQLEKHGLHQCDIIISSIPFVVLPEPLVHEILSTCALALKKGGYFSQFHYSRGMKMVYQSYFEEVDTDFILLNAPPAFVFNCKK